MTEPEQPVSDGADEAPEVEETTAPARWRAALPLAILLAVVAVLGIGFGAWLMADPPETPQERETEARQDALVAGERFASTLTSFDAAKADQYVDALSELLTDGRQSPCWGEVAKLVPAVAGGATAKAAEQRRQRYEGSVSNRAVASIDSDSGRVLLVVAFQTSAIIDKQRVPLAAQELRLRLEMRTEDGDWLVHDCAIVQPSADDGGDQ